MEMKIESLNFSIDVRRHQNREWARLPWTAWLGKDVTQHIITKLSQRLAWILGVRPRVAFACPSYGGRSQVLASVTASQGERSMLQHLGLPPQPGRLAAARVPPQSGWC